MAKDMLCTTRTDATGGARASTLRSTMTRDQQDERGAHSRRQQAVDAEGAAESRAADRDTLTTYLREIGRVPRLTAAEELELGERIAAGDKEALERLVEANLRLVIAVAKRYRHAGIALHDLVQEGNIGLLRAAQTFDYRTGNRFSTYAVWWIRQAVSRALASQAYAIRVPVHIHEAMGRAARDASRAADGEPGEGEGAEKPSISTEVQDLSRRVRQTISLDRVHGEEGDAALANAVADPDAPSPFEATANKALRERLVVLLGGLAARERDVVSLRYGLVDGHPRTCAEVGAHLHLTSERARQLEVLALNKLRYGPGGAELEHYLS